MKNILFILCITFISDLTFAMSPGIENIREYKERLKGKNVAVIANRTSIADGMHSVDFLRKNGVNIIKVFAPEHGFRGDIEAGGNVGSYKDKTTGLPVISLYGKKYKPASEDLKDIDIVIFDIQDVGVRFYTYISTLHYVMEACAENKIPVIVMDRPNPNAFYIDGPILEPEHKSFVGMHPVPIVYGMTIGEYAQMINGEAWLKDNVQCELTVIPCEGWKREMIVKLKERPSPNLPDEISIMLYPSTCLFEGTVVNEGRGTYTPFQVFGHPKLQNMPYSYTPVSIPGMSNSPKCKGEKCYGMDLRDKYDEVKQGARIQLKWLLLAYKNYNGQPSFFIPFFEKLAGTKQLREDILAGKNEDEIRKSWDQGLQEFKKIREKYLIY